MENPCKDPAYRCTRFGYLNLLDPKPEEILLRDIAWGLAHQCRYTGLCTTYYSVAEHCINVSLRVPEHLRAQALLHDAAEAYIGDMPTPAKKLLPDYYHMEDKILQAVFDRFHLDSWEWPEIKRADLEMLQIEANDIMHDRGEGWASLQVFPPDSPTRKESLVKRDTGYRTFDYWTPLDACRQFMDYAGRYNLY